MKTVAQNRKARHDYEIVDTVEAGLMLEGHEVKSCRAGNVNLKGSYVSLLTGSPLLKHAHISRYRFASNLDDYNPDRDRKLLLSKKDIERLVSATQEKGVTVIPLELRAGKYIKVLIGLGRGRKRHDKRQKIKEKDVKRRLQQSGDY